MTILPGQIVISSTCNILHLYSQSHGVDVNFCHNRYFALGLKIYCLDKDKAKLIKIVITFNILFFINADLTLNPTWQLNHTLSAVELLIAFNQQLLSLCW